MPPLLWTSPSRSSALPLAATLLAAALAVGACTVRGEGRFTATSPRLVYVEEAPPPPRVIVTPAPRLGYIWIEGRWDRRGSRWSWRDGRWAQARQGQAFTAGRWERRARGHVWVEGSWRTGGVTTRDHRR